jgi:hypothetical protein
MEAVQTFPLPFNKVSQVPRLRTLNDMRMGHDHDAALGAPSTQSKRPLLMVALLIAAGAAIAIGVKTYSDQNATKNAATRATQDAIVAATPPQPVAPSVVMPVPGATENGAHMGAPLSKLDAVNMPMTAHVKTHSSEVVNPVKSKSVALAKSAPVTAKRASANAVTPISETAPTQREALPAFAPTPAIVEEKSVAPAAAATPEPSVAPTEPAPQ